MSWSSRLEEQGALPGTGLTDKEAAWDKLYDRLKGSEAPRRRKLIWIWPAAACILLIVAAAAVLLKDRREIVLRYPAKALSVNKADHPGSGRTGTLQRTATPDKTAQSSSAAHSAATPRSAVSGKRTLPQPSIAGQSRPSTAAHADLNMLLAGDADTPALVLAPRPDLSNPPKMTAAAVIPPKKELRVIHINELEPPQPTPSIVKGPRLKPGGLRIGLYPQETLRPSTTYAEPDGQSILIFKHAQNP
jgi:hypothetical protein